MEATHETRIAAGLSLFQLWVRYFGLGGMRTRKQLDAQLSRASDPSPHEHDLVAHALNERFTELGRNHPVRYRGSER